MSTPAVSVKVNGLVDNAMPARPKPYNTLPPISTRKAPNRSASMPAKMPNTPQDRFWMAMRKGEGLARPVLGLGDGLQPQTKAVAHAHGEGDDHRGARQNLSSRKVSCGV
jgi:hypothetical protein